MTKKQNALNACFLFAIVALSIPLIRRMTLIVRANGISPYTVTLKLTVHDAQGKQLTPEVITTTAVRSDGSRSITSLQSRATVVDATRYVHMASGGLVTIGDLMKIKTSWNRPTPDITDWYRDPSRNCAVTLSGKRVRTSRLETFSGEEYLGNIRTAKITHDSNAEWFAIQAGCAMVKARYDFGERGINEQNFVSLTVGQPLANLFDTNGLREVGPAEFQNLRRNVLAIPCSVECEAADQKDNERYLSQKALLP